MNKATEDLAKCKEVPGAFELAFSRDLRDNYYMINRLCYQCPIRLTCLSEAMDNDYYGIFGGTTRSERLVMKSIQRAYAGV